MTPMVLAWVIVRQKWWQVLLGVVPWKKIVRLVMMVVGRPRRRWILGRNSLVCARNRLARSRRWLVRWVIFILVR